MRHFTALSRRNFGIDTGFYPLGSCTMKYNPRVNERLVGLPGFRDLHPLVEDDAAQGALELEWNLQGILREVTGLPANQPPACGRQSGRTDRAAGDAGLFRRPRRGRAAAEDRDPGHGPRHEPGERDDGRLRGDAGRDRRPRQHRRRRPARQGRRAHGRADAHEPVDAGSLRREDRADPRHLPRGRGTDVSTTART